MLMDSDPRRGAERLGPLRRLAAPPRGAPGRPSPTPNPDLAAFIEPVKTDDYDQVEDLLGPGYEIVYESRRDRQGVGIALASRWPIQRVHELDLARDATGPRTSTMPRSPPRSTPPSRSGRCCSSRANPKWEMGYERERELQALVAARFAEHHAREHGGHVILAGDFDAVPEAASIRFLTGRQSLEGVSVCYRDAWASAHPRRAPGTRSRPRNPLVRDGEMAWDVPRRIDYVFVRCDNHGPTLDVGGCERLFDEPRDGVWASDHFGVAGRAGGAMTRCRRRCPARCCASSRTTDLGTAVVPMRATYGETGTVHGIAELLERERARQPTLWLDVGDLTVGPAMVLLDERPWERAGRRCRSPAPPRQPRLRRRARRAARGRALGSRYPMLCANVDAGLPRDGAARHARGPLGAIGLAHPDGHRLHAGAAGADDWPQRVAELAARPATRRRALGRRPAARRRHLVAERRFDRHPLRAPRHPRAAVGGRRRPDRRRPQLRRLDRRRSPARRRARRTSSPPPCSSSTCPRRPRAPVVRGVVPAPARRPPAATPVVERVRRGRGRDRRRERATVGSPAPARGATCLT